MKLTCTQENFKKAIFNSERIVSKQNTLPILNNILIEAGKGGIKLSATNLEIGVIVKMGAKIEKEGKITIPAKLISNFINNLPAGENINLETTEQGLKIKSGSLKALIKGLSAEDFPLLPKRTTEFLLSIPGSKLKNVLAKVMTCVAFNETRQELTGVNIGFEKKGLFFAATDSFRLAEHKIAVEEKQTDKEAYETFINKIKNIIVPANTLAELSRIIPNEEEVEVKVAVEEGQIFFELGGTQIVSRLINGKYPEYKHIMPKEYNTRAVGSKNLFLSAVRIASIFTASKSSEAVVKISPETKKVMIEASSVEIGENSSEVIVDSVGTDQEVVLNSRYLLDGLNTINTSQVALLVNSGSSPVALKEINEKTGEVLDEYTYIVMPIKK